MPRTNRYQNDAEARERVRDAIQHLPTAWVICRDLRHAWTVSEDFHVSMVRPDGSPGEAKRTLLCARCGSRRQEVYTVSIRWGLTKETQWYEYTEGYQLKGVPRGVKPAEILRQEQYRRALGEMGVEWAPPEPPAEEAASQVSEDRA
jgi:hypothetical protein